MIKCTVDSSTLYHIIQVELNKSKLESVNIPVVLSTRFRKNTKKRSSYASNKIEGNPIGFERTSEIIDSTNTHLIKPEQEIVNYYKAIELLDDALNKKEPFSIDLLLRVQKQICDKELKEKIGIRGVMPPGVLFAVYDNKTNQPEYIPPESSDIIPLLNELVDYINSSKDHPLIKAAIVHYQLVTIHPFEDGNGRTARIMSNYILSYYGYGFKNIGSLEEYFAYDIDEYYQKLQMGLPPLYYNGRDNPPNPSIWFEYFFKIIELYSSKVLEIAKQETSNDYKNRYLMLSNKAKSLLDYINKHKLDAYQPIELAAKFKVTNRTIINWSIELVKHGFVKPNIINERITSYIIIR